MIYCTIKLNSKTQKSKIGTRGMSATTIRVITGHPSITTKTHRLTVRYRNIISILEMSSPRQPDKEYELLKNTLRLQKSTKNFAIDERKMTKNENRSVTLSEVGYR